MEWLTVLRDKFKVLFRREQFDRDLEEEMQFHQELQAEELHENGMSADEAQNVVRRRFGNTTQLREAGWHAWGWGALERLFQDLRFTVRSLRRSPGFAAAVVLLLAFAIWMNTTVFTVVHAVMFAPLPFDRSEELVRLHETNAEWGNLPVHVTEPNFIDWRAGSRAFGRMAAVLPSIWQLEGDGASERVPGAFITEDFFSVLRIRPAAGRVFLPEDYAQMRPGGTGSDDARVVVISYGLWQRRFGGSPAAVGATMRMSSQLVTAVVRIVGVMPAEVASAGSSLGQSDIWVPVVLAGDQMGNSRVLTVIARRRPGISNQQAQAEMDVIARRLQAKRPTSNAGWGVQVADLRELAPSSYRTSLLFLAGAVALVLLIACANVANLMLARGATRRREMATRTALGAGRLRLVAQLATESVFLSLAAGVLAFALSLASVRAVVAVAPLDLPRLAGVGINADVFWFCMIVALATGLLCGVAPALWVSKFDLSASLKEGGAASTRMTSGILSHSLVVLEVGVSLVLLVGAGLLARSFVSVLTLKLGFQPDHVLGINLQPIRHEKLGPGAYRGYQRYYPDLLLRLRSIPGVEAAAQGDMPPRTNRSLHYYAAGATKPVVGVADYVDAQYFRTLNIPLLAGRLFSDSEHVQMPQVAVVNRTAARLTWPTEDPIGKRIRYGHPTNPRWVTVVGVVEDVRNRGWQTDPCPQVYFPATGPPSSLSWLVLRTSGKASAVTPAVRAVIHSLDSNLAINRLATVEENLASATAGLRFNTLLMSLFAVLAFVLATSGVYSLMSYTVTLRTREMSIRMALGADRADILRLIVQNGAVLVGIGVALGLAGALGAVRFLSSLLYQVAPRDPLAFAAATALLVLAALAACYIPARRAASVDVVETLRQE